MSEKQFSRERPTHDSLPPNKHVWTFFRAGGVNQVVLRTGADVARLKDLDQKLWMVLAMPVAGVEFDARTAQLLDADGDGRIRPPEILAAVEWAQAAFKNLDDLIEGGDSVALASIKDPMLLAGAQRILANLGKSPSMEISMADVSDQAAVFAKTRFNGDGVIPGDAAEDDATQKAINEIVDVMGGRPDRSGKLGIDQNMLDTFFDQAAAFVAWSKKGVAGVLPLGMDGTRAAARAVQAVKAKINDYFARCRLAAFDERAQGALNREETAYLALAAQDLTLSSAEIAALPLAHIEPGRPLPLDSALNPAWMASIAELVSTTIVPLMGSGRETLTEDEWISLQSKVAPFDAWMAEKPVTRVEVLGVARLEAMLTAGVQTRIADLIKQDLALESENAQFMAVEKLLRFKRDLFTLLCNYVNFSDFYSRRRAIFQAGTLYLDARACNLCIAVSDAGKHAALAGMAGAFLAYCELSRADGRKRSIVAVFTDGDSDMLMVGRNGVFYDRKGQDWDATITKVIPCPISLREAFWLPYKKLVRLIEEQVAKRAGAAETASTAKLTDTAATVVNSAAATPAVPKKIDMGAIALIGAAIGGVSALIGGFLQALFGLGLWLPLGVAGIMLLISLPSVILAALKLRVRNLGPILDANGWAVNTRAVMNVPFGAALTELARLPEGSTQLMTDPYAKRRSPWKAVLTGVILIGLACAWWLGRLDGFLPVCLQKSGTPTPVAPTAPPADPPTAG